MKYLAPLVIGLGADSRTKLEMNGMKLPLNTMLLAGILDRLTLLIWSNSKDGQKGYNKPKMVLEELLGEDKHSNEITAYDTPEEFEEARRRIIERS